MKKILLLIIILLTAFSCSPKKISEKEFTVIWQEYLKREFEESFDEKQSVSQKEKILGKLLTEAGVSRDAFLSYMKNNHNDKYKKIFME